jgi:hypothetical protein
MLPLQKWQLRNIKILWAQLVPEEIVRIFRYNKQTTVMTDLKIKQMDDVSKLHINLQGAIIELVEEGYSEVEIKKYLSIKFKDAQNFLEEYLAL